MRTLRFLAVLFAFLWHAAASHAAAGAGADAAHANTSLRSECPASAAGGLLLAQAPCPQGTLTCITYFCLNEGRCCPAGSPFLSHCSCRCFTEVPTDCGSYSKCQKQ
jgi:hypothetical protein